MDDALAAYAGLLRRWAPRLNLVSLADLPRLEDRHVADSLRLLPIVDAAPPGPCIDVGSGAGLPGVPLAIARPARVWRLLEPRAARVSFLEEVVRQLELDAEVVRGTAEEAAKTVGYAAGHALATARALASPTRSFELLKPLVAPGGTAAVIVGAGAPLPAEAEAVTDGIAIVQV